jgi:hypothetical protein
MRGLLKLCSANPVRSPSRNKNIPCHSKRRLVSSTLWPRAAIASTFVIGNTTSCGQLSIRSKEAMRIRPRLVPRRATIPLVDWRSSCEALSRSWFTAHSEVIHLALCDLFSITRVNRGPNHAADGEGVATTKKGFAQVFGSNRKSTRASGAVFPAGIIV